MAGEAKVRDLTLDRSNANKGTKRGRKMLDDSLRELGAGRSILVDREGRVIAGNKTLEAAEAAGIEDVLLVQSDGTQLIAVQRTDLDLEGDDRARRLAYADNRVAELDLVWEPEQLALDMEAGLPLDDFWTEEELEKMGAIPGPEEEEAELTISPELFERHDYLVFYFDNEFDWQVAVERLEVPMVLSGQVGKRTLAKKGLGRVLPASKLLELLHA
jgi:hypothetical protein